MRPKIWVLCGSALSIYAESSVYFFMIFRVSQENSPWLLTLVSLATLLPSVALAPLLGWAIDKLPVKTVWIAVLLFSAVLSLGMGLTDQYWLWVFLLTLQTLCSIVSGAALFKTLPLVEGFTEKTASSHTVGMQSILAVVTPPVAGFIFAQGRSTSFFISALLLLLATLLIYRGIPSLTPSLSVEKTSLHDILLGLGTVQNLSLLKFYIPIMFAVVLLTTIEDLSGIIYLQEISSEYFETLSLPGVSPGILGYSIAVAGWALGSLLFSVALAKSRIKIGSTNSLIYGGLLVCFALFIEGISNSFLLIVVIFILGGAGNAVHNIGVRNTVYENVPHEKQGRTWTFIGAAFTVFSALGKFLGTPYLLGEPRWVIAFSGLAGLVLIVGFMLRFQPKIGAE